MRSRDQEKKGEREKGVAAHNLLVKHTSSER